MEVKELLFADILDRGAEKFGEKDAFCFMDKAVSYGQLRELVDGCAAKLLRMGLKKGEHVGIWAVNSIPWMVAFFGVIKAGGVAVLLNYGLKHEDNADLLLHSDVKYLLFGTNKETMKDRRAAYSVAKEVGIEEDRVFDIETAGVMSATPEEKALLGAIRKEQNSKDPALIIFTTGTSAKPKAVLLSQFAVINNARFACDMYADLLGGRFCLALPLFHSYGLSMAMCYLYQGATTYMPEAMSADVINGIVSKNNVTDLASVGAIFMMLMNHPDFEEKLAPYLSFGFVGGGFSTPVQMMRMETSFRHATFINAYGQTECAPYITIPRPDANLEKRATTVGAPMPGTEVLIFDSKKGFLPDGQIGEIVVKGYNVMNGYYGMPKEAQPFDENGYLHTGDLGYFDADGYLHLSGRIKDIIIYKGENISPTEIEEEITAMEEIREVKVIGAPHPIHGESVEACVSLNPGFKIDEQDMKDRLKGKIATFKIPSHFFIYESLPMNTNGKLDLRTLKSDMLEKIRTIRIGESLDAGMRVMSLQIKNTSYNIVPTVFAVQTLAENIGFSKTRVRQIGLAVEEMLTERIENAFADVGDIRIDFVFTSEWLRIRFSDSGSLYDLEKSAEEGMSAKIILKMVDSYCTEEENGVLSYCMDFLYEKDFDMRDFLLHHEKRSQ